MSEFETFNDAYFGNKTFSPPSTFHRFSSLPIELRLRIWNFGLRQNRLLTVALFDDKTKEKSTEGEHTRYSEKNHLGNAISGSPYLVDLRHCHSFSPLLGTTGESRQAALSYYRIRFPIQSISGKRSYCYLNPDHDHLYVLSLLKRSVADLLNDLRAYDPHDTGVKHLAFYSGMANGLQFVGPGDPSSTADDCFKKTLQSLESLWIVHLLTQDARIMLGPLAGNGNYEIGLNRSVPIFPVATDFTFFNTDPRPIEPDLRKMAIGHNPGRAKQIWEDMERRFGVDAPKREISYVLSASGNNDYNMSLVSHVHGPKSLRKYLRKEQEIWESWEEKLPAIKGKRGNDQVLSAGGFWVFPGDTFDGLPMDQRSKNVQDMKGRQPALGLFEF